MPLVFAVLIILVLIVNARESSRKNANKSAFNEKSRRKTNAKLEQRTLDIYMKHGYSFDDAFKKTYADMTSAGYDPCIPREAYNNQEGIESSKCKGYDIERYDSLLVRQRRQDAITQWEQDHPGTHISKAAPEELEFLTYNNFPKTEWQYLHDVKRGAVRASAEPVGTFIIYPRLGTCEVLAHNWIGDGASGGTYTLKVLKTGKVVTYVKIGDTKIRRQGQ